MPIRSGGAAGSSSRSARGTEDWSDSSSLSPPSTSSSAAAPNSSIGEVETDVRKNFIDSAADRARVNLRRMTVGDASSPETPLSAPSNQNFDENASGIVADGGTITEFQYPEPEPQLLPSASSPSTPPVVQRRIKVYKSFGASSDFVSQQIPAENPQHFSKEGALHTHYIIKKVSTSQCDECKAKSKGEEIYKCSACVKQICQPCMEGRLNRERDAQQNSRARKANGLAEREEDDYKWRWQGEYRHEGLKLCYEAREASGAKGDFKIGVPLSILSPSVVGDQTVTVFMTRDDDADEKGKKRLRAESDNGSASDGGSNPKRNARKKARKQEIPRSAPGDHPSPADTLRRNVHGKKALQQLMNIAAAHHATEDDWPMSDSEDESPTRLRPSPLDLRGAQPSPTLPQVARPRQLFGRTLAPLPQANPPGQPRAPSQYPPPRQDIFPPRRDTFPLRQATAQPQPPGPMMWAPVRLPQVVQYPPQSPSPYGHPAFPYSQPQMSQPAQLHSQQCVSSVRQQDLQHHAQPNTTLPNPNWGPRPPLPSSTTATVPQPASSIAPATMWAPPAGTLMQVQLGDAILTMTWNEYQAHMQSRHQPPATEPNFQPPNTVRRGTNETTHHIPCPNNDRPEHTAIFHGREVAFLPFTNVYPVQTVAAPWPMGVVHYERSHSMEEVMNVVNERWSRQRHVNQIVPQGQDSPILINDVDDGICRSGIAEPTASGVVESSQPLEANTAMTEARDDDDDNAQQADLPEEAKTRGDDVQQAYLPEEGEPRPERHSSVPPPALHPPRRFPTPPSLRKPRPAALDSRDVSDWLPSSPPVPTESGAIRNHPASNTDDAMNDAQTADSNASEVDTVLLSPSSLHRVSEEPPSSHLPPLAEPPSTPLPQTNSSNPPSTMGSRQIPARTPTLPAYHNAHHSTVRAENAINGERLEAHRRAVVRAMLDQVPESHTLGLMGDSTPTGTPLPRRPWLSPSREQVQAMMSSPPAGGYGRGSEAVRRRGRDTDAAEDGIDRNDAGGRVDLSEGHQLCAGGTPSSSAPRGGRQTPSNLSARRRGGQVNGTSTIRGRTAGADANNDSMDTDPVSGPPTDDIDQDADFDETNDADDGEDEADEDDDEDEPTSPSSTMCHPPTTQRSRARINTNTNGRSRRISVTNLDIRQQSSTSLHGQDHHRTDGSRLATPRSRAGRGAQGDGGVDGEDQHSSDDNNDDDDEDDNNAPMITHYDGEHEHAPTTPPTPTRRTRSGKEYTGEGTRRWGVDEFLGGEKRGRG